MSFPIGRPKSTSETISFESDWKRFIKSLLTPGAVDAVIRIFCRSAAATGPMPANQTCWACPGGTKNSTVKTNSIEYHVRNKYFRYSAFATNKFRRETAGTSADSRWSESTLRWHADSVDKKLLTAPAQH